MSSTPVIELWSVTKIYPGPVRALDSSSLLVEQGERCCLLGPNGAGKTTIMRLLQGALRPNNGELLLFGRRAEGDALLEAKGHMGIVAQNPGLYPDLTVREYLDFVRCVYRAGRPPEVADSLKLGALMDRPLSSLSGGYQRRLLLAAAVLSEPSLLLLDEPTVGLDPIAAAETRRLLVSAMRNRTVLMSTHNLSEAEELCETVIIVRGGRVLVHERIEDLRRQAAPRVHLAARQGPDVLASAVAALGLEWSPDGDGIWLQPPEPDRDMPGVLRRLLADGVDVYECKLVPPTLEDLFVDVVTRS